MGQANLLEFISMSSGYFFFIIVMRVLSNLIFSHSQ